jgi:hypothetical protein
VHVILSVTKEEGVFILAILILPLSRIREQDAVPQPAAMSRGGREASAERRYVTGLEFQLPHLHLPVFRSTINQGRGRGSFPAPLISCTLARTLFDLERLSLFNDV